MMKKIFKPLLIALLAILCVNVLLACKPVYKGEYVEFFTHAVNEIPFAQGFIFGAESYRDADIRVVEKDEYGRTLVYYCECIEYEEEFFNYQIFLFINQKSDQTYTYYYPHYSYYAFNVEIKNNGDRYDHYGIGYEPEEFISDILQKIEDKYPNAISNLKTLNDWGKPIDESKCLKALISNERPTSNLKIRDDVFEDIARKTAQEQGYKISKKQLRVALYEKFLLKDYYGRELYCLPCAVEEYYEKKTVTYRYNVFIIFQPDGSYSQEFGVLTLQKTHNAYDILKQFKQNNGWNNPI